MDGGECNDRKAGGKSCEMEVSIRAVYRGRAGEGADGCWDDSTACAAAAVIGSHHSFAIFTVSPPIQIVSVPITSHQGGLVKVI